MARCQLLATDLRGRSKEAAGMTTKAARMTDHQYRLELWRLAQRNYTDACLERAHRRARYEAAVTERPDDLDALLDLKTAWDDAQRIVEARYQEREQAISALEEIEAKTRGETTNHATG